MATSSSTESVGDSEGGEWPGEESISARVGQLERTVKWWSECTVSWREKWGRTVTERDKLRKENYVLKGRNEALITEFHLLKKQSDKLRTEIGRKKAFHDCTATAKTGLLYKPKLNSIASVERESDGIDAINQESDTDSMRSQIINKNAADESELSFAVFLEDVGIIEGLLSEQTRERNSTTTTTCRIKIDHVTNAIITEKLSAIRDYVTSCNKFVMSCKQEYAGLKTQVSELTAWKTSILKEYELAKGTLASKTFSHGEETKKTHTSEKLSAENTSELYVEIQRLREENSNEWRRREDCETKVSELKRELRREAEMKTELEKELKKMRDNSEFLTEKRKLKDEINAKDVEVTQLKSMCTKLKRQVQEKGNELVHEKTRADFLENEVKDLRDRIDVLKGKVFTSEETVDQQSNSIRRLQRCLDEQVGQTEALTEELKHATIKLQRQSKIITCRSDDSIEMQGR